MMVFFQIRLGENLIWQKFSGMWESIFNSSKFSHGIYYCDSFAESKFDVKYVNTVRSATQ